MNVMFVNIKHLRIVHLFMYEHVYTWEMHLVATYIFQLTVILQDIYFSVKVFILQKVVTKLKLTMYSFRIMRVADVFVRRKKKNHLFFP